jgi:hypothetical protein
MRVTPKQAVQDPALTQEEREIVALDMIHRAKSSGRLPPVFSQLNPAHLKLHLLKQALNYFIPRIGGISEIPQPHHDVGRMVQRISNRVSWLAEKVGENLEGKRWEVNPLTNLINLTKAGSNILIYIAEHDPHYLRWSMVLMWNVWREMEELRRMDPKGFAMFESLAKAIPSEGGGGR